MSTHHLPKISLVTPVYNGADLLVRNVESVAASNYPNLEHILVDNKSTDSSWPLMNELAARFPHVRVSRQDEIQGAAPSINHGFSLATGDIFGWLGHDDRWFPTTPWHVSEHWKENPDTDFLCGAVRIMMPDGTVEIDRQPLSNLDLFDLFVGVHIVNQEGCFWRSEVHRPLDPAVRGAFDYDLWLRLFQDDALRVHRTEKILACFQRRHGQLSGDLRRYTEEMNRCRALFCSRLLQRPPEEFQTFQEQLHGLSQVPFFQRLCAQRMTRDGAYFAPRLNEALCLAGIFFFIARPQTEIVFEVYEMQARSIALLENNRPRAVAKVRSVQARLTILVPDSGFVGVDLTNRGLDDPNACYIKCARIRCGDRVLAVNPKAHTLTSSAPEIRLAYPA